MRATATARGINRSTPDRFHSTGNRSASRADRFPSTADRSPSRTDRSYSATATDARGGRCRSRVTSRLHTPTEQYDTMTTKCCSHWDATRSTLSSRRTLSRLDDSDTLPYPACASGSTPCARRKGHCYRASSHGVSIAQAGSSICSRSVVAMWRRVPLPLTRLSDAHLHSTDCHHER
jgi:hypothetical protein